METGLKRHEPFYLKYRPQSLDGLVGQQAVTRTLTNAIEHDRLSHAYLFTGPRGTGKTSTARILARSLNCQNGPTVKPCQQCASCLEIKNGTSPAVFEIDAASNNSVDDARSLIERAPLVAVGGRFKLYIIDECHMLTKEAFNALLKTIEEPPPQVVFVLATTEEHKVPSTIISRCQRLMFRLVSQEDLAPYLQQIAKAEAMEIEDEALQIIARRSGGGLRDALGLLDQASLLSAPGKPVTVADLLALMGAVHEDVLLEISQNILEHNGQAVLPLLNRLLVEGREPAVIAQEIARHFLNLIKASYVAGDLEDAGNLQNLIVGSPEYIRRLKDQAPQFDCSELALMIEHLDRLESNCRRSTQPAMHIEMGLLGLCHRQDIHLLRDLTERVSRLEAGGASLEAPAGRATAGRPPAIAESTKTTGVQQPAATPKTPKPALDASNAAIQSPTKSTSSAKPAMAEKSAQPATASNPDDSESGIKPATVSGPDDLELGTKPATVSGLDDSESGTKPATVSGPDDSESGTKPATVSGPDDLESGTKPATVSGPDDSESGTKPAIASSSDDSASSIQPTAVPSPDELKSNAQSTAAAGLTSPVPGQDRDEVWERLLEELERISLPAYSLVSAYAFPLSLEQQELVVGVTKENFQKMVENKADKIKKAAEIVTGRVLSLRVKVVSQAPARKAPEPALQSVPAASLSGRNKSSLPPPAGELAGATTPAAVKSLALEEPSSTSQSASEKSATGLATKAADSPDDADSGGAKEAYKIFEGPGSRQIG